VERTEVSFDFDTVPSTIRQYIQGAKMYDSSCSEHAKTFFVAGSDRAFLKISNKGALKRECEMTTFLHQHRVAPNVIAYDSDSDRDYLLAEAVRGEDGTARGHIENPGKLAAVFGESLSMLHALPIEGCPYEGRTAELLRAAEISGADLDVFADSAYSPVDSVVIHGDYCLPNIVMDNFAFMGFIDLGCGGVGDKHYDIYWGIWTLRYNLKTDAYKEVFLDAYGRGEVDANGLDYFTRLLQMTE
jgi:kanamycin kinase